MKEEIKKTTDGYTNSMQDMWEEYVAYINSIKEICDNTPIKVNKGRTNNSMRITIPDAKYKLCDIYETISAWTEWSKNVAEAVVNIPLKTVGILARALGESAEYALNIINQGVNAAANWLSEKLSNLTVNNKWVKKIIKKLKLILLYVKKALLSGKLFTLKLSKKVLTFAANNKVTSALQTAFMAVITFIQTNAAIIDVVLKVIENLCSSLIGLALDGGAMGFFITPKSITNGIVLPQYGLTMKPANANNDIYTNIADAIINPIEEGFRQAAIVAASGKNAKMIASVTKNVTTIVSTDELIDLPDSDVSLEQSLDLSALKAAIALAVSLLATPEAMPKYERLHPGNIGFLMWLITTFEPTMKKCFGLPGFP